MSIVQKMWGLKQQSHFKCLWEYVIQNIFEFNTAFDAFLWILNTFTPHYIYVMCQPTILVISHTLKYYKTYTKRQYFQYNKYPNNYQLWISHSTLYWRSFRPCAFVCRCNFIFILCLFIFAKIITWKGFNIGRGNLHIILFYMISAGIN